MKTYELIIYLMITGIVLGYAQNKHYEKCGIAQEITTEILISALMWPAVPTLVLIVDEDAMVKAGCEQ